MRMRRTRMRKIDSHNDNDDNNYGDGNGDSNNDNNKDNKMTRTRRTWDEDTTIKKRTRKMRDDNDEG